MKRLSTIALLGIVTSLFALCANAAAAQITVGEVAAGTALATCNAGPYDNIPGGTGASLYRVPENGVITSWSTNAAAGVGQEFAFKVFRPEGEKKYLVVGHDGPRPLVPGIVNTFATNIPVQAGDLIGTNDANASSVPNACLVPSGTATDNVIYPPIGNSADGTVVEEEGNNGSDRTNVRATLQPTPTINSISPTSGPVTGGTSVLISGANFIEVKALVFGSTTAAITVKSETEIVATAPASAGAGSVPVTVTTRGGSATAAQTFDYTAASVVLPPIPAKCKVPKLKGRSLKSAIKRIRAADCRVGKLIKKNGASAKNGAVVKQVPKPGTTVPAHTKVKLTLAP